MEIDKANLDDNVEEEYVMLDLDAVCSQIDIPPDEPYILSKLDTANPVLTIGNKLKLIGEYVETMGTCLIFSKNEKAPLFHEEGESTESNLSKKERIISPNTDLIRPVTSLQKVLKFRLLSETEEQYSTEKPSNPCELEEDTMNVD